MIESNTWASRSLEMRSTEMDEKVVVDLTVRGVSLGTMGWILTVAD